MQRIVAALLLGGLAFLVLGKSASARMPYFNQFSDQYKGNEAVAAAAKEAKCTVCHDPAAKKIRNEYGKAVNKYLTKADYDKLKEDAAALKKKIAEALQAAEGEKNKEGKTFGEVIKSGKLPAS